MRPFFDAAIAGYAEAAQGLLTPAEWSAIPRGTLTITVELAARFCADALRESYFGWNRARYESSSAHNQARVHGQLLLAAGIRAALAARSRMPRPRHSAPKAKPFAIAACRDTAVTRL